MCAVGVFIPDALYSPNLEGLGCLSKTIQNVLLEAGVVDAMDVTDHASARKNLLHTLQRLHDLTPVESWLRELQTVAEKFGLNYVQSS